MTNPIIGKCPRCGCETAQLLQPQYQALVDHGQIAMTCAACQEKTVAKLTMERMREIKREIRDPAKRKAAIAEVQAKIRAKVSEPEPAPAAKAEEKPAAKAEPAK